MPRAATPKNGVRHRLTNNSSASAKAALRHWRSHDPTRSTWAPYDLARPDRRLRCAASWLDHQHDATNRSHSLRRRLVSRARRAPAALEPLSAQIWWLSQDSISRHHCASNRLDNVPRPTTASCNSASIDTHRGRCRRARRSPPSVSPAVPQPCHHRYRTPVLFTTSSQEIVLVDWCLDGATATG